MGSPSCHGSAQLRTARDSAGVAGCSCPPWPWAFPQVWQGHHSRLGGGLNSVCPHTHLSDDCLAPERGRAGLWTSTPIWVSWGVDTCVAPCAQFPLVTSSSGPLKLPPPPQPLSADRPLQGQHPLWLTLQAGPERWLGVTGWCGWTEWWARRT